MVIIRILQPFLCFSFIRIYLLVFLNLLNFYPVTRFLVTPLLVTALLCLVTHVWDVEVICIVKNGEKDRRFNI